MARSHHRKKHKHFQPPPHIGTHKEKGNAATIIAIAGAVIGLIISYSATEGDPVWVIAVTIVASALGYLIGRRIDKSGEKR